MDTRLLEYFLAIAEEGNMTRAAENLHVTQPTLSKQLNKLEELVGAELFQRTSRRMILTEAGLTLHDRARIILELTEKTITDLQQTDTEIRGTLKMSVAESDAFREVAQIFKTIYEKYPNIQFDIHSGDVNDVTDPLDQGIVDFGLLVGTPNLEKYNVLKLAQEDEWGVLFRKGDSFSEHEAITPEMLKDKPLLVSRQAMNTNELSGWSGYSMEEANVIATYNLINNAALMAEEGLGYLFSLDRLANTTETGNLSFRPLDPSITAPLHLVWRKNQRFSPAAEVFLEAARKHLH